LENAGADRTAYMTIIWKYRSRPYVLQTRANNSRRHM